MIGQMPGLFSSTIVAVIVFATTNVDDLLVLAAFFASAVLQSRSIVIGQFLGIATLLAASALIACTAIVVPSGYVALFGLVPLGLGIAKLLELRRHGTDESDAIDRNSAQQRKLSSQ